MTCPQRALKLVLVGLSVFQLGTPTVHALPVVSASRASFEETSIDMSTNWGEATACAVTPTGNRCYRTEKEMDAAESMARSVTTGGAAGELTASSCSTTLRLYTGNSYAGSVVSFSTQATWINLSTYGIDNATSSYKVGACSSTFRDGVAGTGTTYPGSTAAGVQSPTMLTGWDNTVSSVRVN